MGQQQSLLSVNADYNLQESISQRPYSIHKNKYCTVKIDKENILKIHIPNPDLTVGWLLSEVTRRYNTIYEKSSSKLVKNKEKMCVIVGLKWVLFYPTLDIYLEQLDNSLAPIKHKTAFEVHFAKISNKKKTLMGESKIWPEDFNFLNVIGRGSYSTVVIARKNDSGKLYAMKIMK